MDLIRFELKPKRFCPIGFVLFKVIVIKQIELASLSHLTILSQSRSHGFLVWCGRTRHERRAFARSLALRARRSYDRASRSLSRYALKSSTCEQVYHLTYKRSKPEVKKRLCWHCIKFVCVLYGICALPCTVVNASIFRYKSQLVILVQLVVIIICKVSIWSPYILCIFPFYW